MSVRSPINRPVYKVSNEGIQLRGDAIRRPSSYQSRLTRPCRHHERKNVSARSLSSLSLISRSSAAMLAVLWIVGAQLDLLLAIRR